KYRRLRLDELEELEKEFIEFLAVHSITGPDWERLTRTDPQKVNEMVDLFSDVVMDKVLDKIKCLQFREPSEWKVFQLGQEKIHLIGLETPEDSPIDLTQRITSDELVDGGVEIYEAEKAYVKKRNLEIFEMIDNGAQMAEETLFYQMKQLLGD
ncbi:MAG: DUF6495 family protein, partial [Bacteroidota bacterium]